MDGKAVIIASPSDYEELMFARGKALHAKRMHAASIYCLKAAKADQVSSQASCRCASG